MSKTQIGLMRSDSLWCGSGRDFKVKPKCLRLPWDVTEVK